MSLNKRRIERSKRSTNVSGGSFARLVDGRNIIRVFPFHHKITEGDFKAGFYKESDGFKVGDEFDEIERSAAVHFTEDGIVNCMVHDCEFCADSKKYLASADKRDQKIGRDMRANKRYHVNAVNMENNEGMQIFALPQSVFSEIISYIDDPEYGESVLGSKGRDFIIDRDVSQDPQNVYAVKLRDANKCIELKREIMEGIVDLFELSVLDPGWKSDKQQSGKSAPAEKEKSVDKVKSPDQNPYKDEESPKERRKDSPAVNPDNPPLPWDEKKIEVGSTVSFKEDGKTHTGKVTKKDGDKLEIETEDSFWDFTTQEVELVESKPAEAPTKQRRKK
jgi:hypothetical protein